MLVFWLACAICHGPRGTAHESEDCSSEGSVWKNEWLQRGAQVPFPGNTGWLDESGRVGSTSTECYRVVRPMESEIC
jgi:hypothetical protein